MSKVSREYLLERVSQLGRRNDAEMIRILLSNANSKCDIEATTKELLIRFGSLDGVLHARYGELKKVKYLNHSLVAYLKVIGTLYCRIYGKKEGVDKFFRGEFEAYLSKKYRDLRHEVVDVFSIDENRNIRAVKTFSNSDRSSVSIDPQQITEFLIDSQADTVVVAHNHPFASYEPSEEDDKFTRYCQLICHLNNFFLLDHFVVGENGVYSYYESGKLYEYYNALSLENLVK